MKLTKDHIVLHDLMFLWIELERQPNEEAMRQVMNNSYFKQKYKNIVDHGGKEFLSWLGKMIIKTKEHSNEPSEHNPER
jgi:hypothetical protein